MKHLPKILLYSRLAFAVAIVALSFFPVPSSNLLVIALMYMGILSDIFDGIIARRLHISTDNFRVLDTIFDLAFYLATLYFVFSYAHLSVEAHILPISIILALECGMYLVSLARFGKLPSPHAILSKFWGLYLVAEFTLLLLGVGGPHFFIALCIGCLVHLDRLLIYILLRIWDHDIPSCYHALLLRQGRTITRKKLFNG